MVGEIKHDLRNQLNNETVSGLMQICMDAPKIENFYQIPPITTWLQLGRKQKCIKPYIISDCLFQLTISINNFIFLVYVLSYLWVCIFSV